MQYIGKYKVIKELGAGGFGAVYLAEDPRLKEQVAIKVFQVKDTNVAAMATSATSDVGEVLNQRFLNEAKTLRQLNRNVHIVDVFEFDEMPDGTPYYVMPYLPHSLRDELGSDTTDTSVIAELEPEDKPKRLPISQSLVYLEQLLLALKDVHKVGLVHRDIKPANLLLNKQLEVQLCDFGIAKMPDAEHSQSGVGMGSRNYMAPEQRQSAKHVDARSDIYSAGVLAYRMITGTLPEGRFADPNTFQPALSDDLNQLILKALSQQKEQRFVDAGEMLQALKQTTQQNTTNTEDEGTSTWVEDNTASIKAELKPLQDKITEILLREGEIPNKDYFQLEALAAIVGLDKTQLDSFIQQTNEQLAPQLAPLQNWLALLTQKAKADELDAPSIQILINAAQSLGLTEAQATAKIKAIQDQHTPKKKPSPKPEKPKVKETVKPSTNKMWVVVVILLVTGVGGYLGYTSYQAQQEEAQQVELAKQKQMAAERQAHDKAWEQAQDTNTITSYKTYLDAWPRGKYRKVALSTQQTLQQAQDEQQASENNKVALTITTTPNDATVQILNIQPKYYDGIKLKIGDYQVKVSRSGFLSQTQNIFLSSKQNQFDFKLEPPPLALLNISVSPIQANIEMIFEEQKPIVPRQINANEYFEAGKYGFKVSALGYRSEYFNLQLKSGEVHSQKIRLTKMVEESTSQFSSNEAKHLTDVGESQEPDKLTVDEVIPIVRIEPKYPVQAALDGKEGWVKLQFTINKVGGVENVKVIEASPKRIFDREAKRALSKWKYKPKIVNGKPVSQINLETRLDFLLLN